MCISDGRKQSPIRTAGAQNRTNTEAVTRAVPPGLYSTEQRTPSSNARAARPAQGYKETACRPSAAGLKVRRERRITPA